MNESHMNRINELLGESVIYESVKKKTKIKLSLDDGSKKEMDFDGSLNDAKKKFSGKKVKTIRKSKSGDIIGEAVIVGVEELNESKELIPFGYFKITYSDGSSKKTEARAKTAEDFKKYLTQDGNDVVTDEDEDGKETKKKIVKVEKLDESAEEKDGWDILDKLKLKDNKREWFKIILDDGAIEEKDAQELFQMIKDDKKLGTIAKKYPKISHGLEYGELENKKGDVIKFAFLNSGDTYALTLVRNPISGKIEITTEGDMVEYLEKKGYKSL